ncbi:MAG: dihydropteroate synthase [Azonexus sp.]|nr:dihydropteroate synthase [Betaproteobacteria bacterium]MBK8917419.1 dihydropteroate synthase [Betaproteobacteria bacterium]MBP6035968.1 dihydropteroate synthase [Azonexus sp.]MBP6906490.1 dihydropteroate synthase [Azonexus sp.]
MKSFRCGSYRFSLDRPLIVGVVNLTPDSFSGDGLAGKHAAAVAHARRQWEEGADILDLGAESSRPGAMPATVGEELDRLLPVLETVCSWGVPVSVDTCKPEVMARALSAGASLINDITALGHPDALGIVSDSDCAICLMHMQGEPRTMQAHPCYGDVLSEVSSFLGRRVEACVAAGVDEDRLLVDPGFGFGKTLQHNLALLRSLGRVAPRGLPILAGLSRKSMLGALTGGRPVAERQAASVAAALLAVQRGAHLLRVHDVAATKDALAVLAALNEGETQ